MEDIYHVTSLLMPAGPQAPVLLCQQKLHGLASILQEGGVNLSARKSSFYQLTMTLRDGAVTWQGLV